MNIRILDEIELDDGCQRLNIGVSNQELLYLGYILESLEGWCNYTTPDRSQPILQVDVPPDFVNDFGKLFNFLVNWKIA
ncbi:MAG: hypothetical protein Q7J16_02280 [Candidatus Cloacimonadales bacterium]|nr:hypothetical protein [Candidatus Cloacimonadales bacterium]